MSWEYLTLDQLGTVSRGKSKHRPRNDPRLYGGEYPFIQTSDIKHADLYLTEYEQTYNEAGLAQSKLWDAETLCITIAANIADTSILRFPACFPDSVMGFIPFKNTADVRFVKYLFDTLQDQCKQISQGTAQDNMSWERLSTIKFPVPPYETQIRIAEILSAYDSLIENNRKQIKLLEETAQRLYKEWFIDLHFPGHETAIINPEKRLPAGWIVGKLGDIVQKPESGKRPKGGINKSITEGVPSIGAENVIGIGRYNYAAEKQITREFFDSMKKGHVRDRDILVYKDGAYTGRVSLFQDNFPYKECAVNEHVFLLRSCLATDQYWLYFTLNQSTIFEMIQRIAISSAQPGINQDDLKGLEIILPTEKLRADFSEYASFIAKQITLLAKQIREAEIARNLILPRIIDGRITL